MPQPTAKIAEPIHVKGVYQPRRVMLPPVRIDDKVTLTRYGIVRMPEPSAEVPLTAWK